MQLRWEIKNILRMLRKYHERLGFSIEAYFIDIVQEFIVQFSFIPI